jgi:polyisoprenyl-phosphate glycosyltransferase
MPKKSINYIVPVYNNSGSLELLLSTIDKTMAPLKKQYSWNYIFVNDGSKDDSYKVLQRLAAKDKRLLILNLSRNFGHQAAVTAGLDNAEGDAVIIMDADLQDPPRVCVELIAKWSEGYQVVYAQRRTRKDTFFKRLTADTYYRMLSSLSSVDIPRNTGDFRLVDKKVVHAIREMKEYHRFLRGMFGYVGFRHIGVQFDRDARHSGKSEYTMKKMIKLAKDGIYGFSDAPLQLASKLGFTFAALSVLGILYAVMIKLFWPHIAVSGWTMIIVSIFLIGGVQLIILGIIGEYVSRVYNEVKGRPNYIIAESINDNSGKME